jgi:hypothetical protein
VSCACDAIEEDVISKSWEKQTYLVLFLRFFFLKNNRLLQKETTLTVLVILLQKETTLAVLVILLQKETTLAVLVILLQKETTRLSLSEGG